MILYKGELKVNDNLSNFKYDYINSLLKKNIMPNMNNLKKLCDIHENYNDIINIKDDVEVKEEIEIKIEHKGEK